MTHDGGVARVFACAVLVALVAACDGGASTGERPTSALGDDTSLSTEATVVVGTPGSEPADSETAAPEGPDIVVDASAPGNTLDPRLFGTNVPAWIGPDRLASPEFRTAAVESGTTLLRLPGGSWSNYYDWLGCEIADESRCAWPWAARPSDFIDLLQATDISGSWTVNINETAESAAAAVAFFNGSVDDERQIGVDRHGVDWQTVGRWAQLRVDGGHSEPADIELWEIGNEVYGANQESGGDGCPSFGWEGVWTCDGAEYVLGDEEHDGYLAFRSAMKAIDPDIEVAAVGVGEPDSWGSFGTDVITTAGTELDAYVVHEYGFDESPSPQESLRRSEERWRQLAEELSPVLDAGIPIAVTEYNLVSGEAGDTAHAMTKTMNALYLADTIGQMAAAGVSIANQWNLANGTTESGTDYGMVQLDDFSARFPQFDALQMWGDVGDTLLPSVTTGDLHIYPTLHDDGTLVIIVINLAQESTTQSMTFVGDIADGSATMGGVSTDDLEADQMQTFGPTPLGSTQEPFDVTLPGWSIARIEVRT